MLVGVYRKKMSRLSMELNANTLFYFVRRSSVHVLCSSVVLLGRFFINRLSVRLGIHRFYVAIGTAGAAVA